MGRNGGTGVGRVYSPRMTVVKKKLPNDRKL